MSASEPDWKGGQDWDDADWDDAVADVLALADCELRSDRVGLRCIWRHCNQEQATVVMLMLLSRLIAEVDPDDARLREWAAQVVRSP